MENLSWFRFVPLNCEEHSSHWDSSKLQGSLRGEQNQGFHRIGKERKVIGRQVALEVAIWKDDEF